MSRVRIYHGVHELDAYRAQWDELARAAPSPPATREWIASCIEAFHKNDELRLIAAHSDDRITGLAALTRPHRSGARGVYRLAGVERLHEPGSLIATDANAMAALLRGVARLGVPAALERVSARAILETLTRGSSPRPGYLLLRPSTPSLYIPLSGSWDEYMAGLPRQRRYDLRRSTRRAHSLGRVRIRRYHPTPPEVSDLLGEAWLVEHRGWKGRRGTSVLCNPAMRDFFRRYGERCAADRRLQVAFLFIDDTPAAAHVSVLYAGRVWVLKVGYDERWQQCSPGLLLMTETIRAAFDEGYHAYELMGSEEPWLHTWTRSRHDYRSLLYYPSTMLGMKTFIVDGAAFAARRLRSLRWSDSARTALRTERHSK